MLLALLEPLDPRRARLLADPLLDGAHRDGGGSRLPHLDLAVGIVDEDALDAVAELVLLLVTEDFIGNGLGGDRWRPGRAGRHAERRERDEHRPHSALPANGTAVSRTSARQPMSRR